MTDKIEFESEEQLRDFLKEIEKTWYGNIGADVFENTRESRIKNAKRNGYIKKSPLQQKVEEAEEMYIAFKGDETHIRKTEIIKELYETIQLFKEKYPDFK